MLVDDLFQTNIQLSVQDLHIIKQECSQFIQESYGIPIHKALPSTYPDLHKVKARFKKKTDEVTDAFNKAFETDVAKLRQRAIFAYSTPPILTEDTDLFYVFPINNYKFLYSQEVTNSSSDYRQVINTLFETFHNTDKAIEIVTDLLKYTYSTENLYEGIVAKAEIIFYGIPFYYAVRVDPNLSYKQIIK